MLPAFGMMAAGLNSPIELVQATVPAFSIMLAVSQLIYGPASDRYGRKPTIFVGLAIFLMGTSVIIFAPTIELVLAGRAIQGAGAGVGAVVARAVLRDRYSGTALAGAMAIATGVFALGPIAAPLTGVFLSSLGSWRFIFAAMAIAGSVLLVINIFAFKETIPALSPKALQPAYLAKSLMQILRNPQSRYFLIFASSAYCALLSLVANAPRVYKSSFGVSELEFATLFALTGIGIFVGQRANRVLIPRVGVLNTTKIAAFILFAACSTTLLFQWTGILNKLTFTALMFAFNTSFMVVISNSTAIIIDPHKEIAGLASAFFGFCTLGAAAIYVTLTLKLFEGDLLRWSMGMSVMTLISLAGFLLARRDSLGSRF